MAFKAVQALVTTTQAYLSNTATQLVLPASIISMLTTQLSGGFTTAAALSDGINYEVVKITGTSGSAVNIIRAQDGTTAGPIARGGSCRFVWTAEGVQEVAPGGNVTCNGAGATDVSGGPNYTIGSQFVQLFAGSGINVTGGYPNFTIENTSVFSPITVTGSGIALATGGPVNYNIAVAPPVFTGGTGISVTGTYPNFTITCTVTGNAGTVTSVAAGTGIAVTGTPSINPTVSLATTGPGAGTYGGITINAYGQITAFSASTITSISTSTSGVTVGGPSSGAVAVNIANAAGGQRGLVALAPPTSGGSNDAVNTTQAVTPAGISAVVTALAATITPASFAVTGNQNSLASASYTNTISGFNIAVAVLSGKSALIDIFVESYDPSNLTVVQSLGIGLFNGGSLLAGNQNIIGTNRQLKYLVVGPLAATLTVKTTALVGTQVVASYYASVTGN